MKKINPHLKKNIVEELKFINNSCENLKNIRFTFDEVKLLNGYSQDIQTIMDSIKTIAYTLTDEHAQEQNEESK